MYLMDDNNALVDSEFSLGVLSEMPCVIVESSGGSNASRGVKRQNPEYNKLLNILFDRIGRAGANITSIVLDSTKVAELPMEDRIASLDREYPISLANLDVDEFRRKVGRSIASLHRDPGAKSSGNAQKKIRICLDRVISADALLFKEFGAASANEVPFHAPSLSDTEREYMRKARVGQGQFRRNLMEAFRSKCPITGIEHPALLIASHIKPWKACTNAERLDGHNGILLSALADRLFDSGLITFDAECRILSSSDLSTDDRRRCHLPDAISLALSDQAHRFMEYHRVFQYRHRKIEA
jgi:hypothetical protein